MKIADFYTFIVTFFCHYYTIIEQQAFLQKSRFRLPKSVAFQLIFTNFRKNFILQFWVEVSSSR